MEEALQSIKREMRENHAKYVNNQLQDALKISKEIQASMPDLSDDIDPFVHIPPLDGRNATAKVQNQVGFPLFQFQFRINNTLIP